PRIPRAKTSLLLHPQPRRPRASLPRSLLPASSQERLPAAAAAVLLARSSCSPLPPLRRAIAGAAAAVLLLPHRCAPLFPTSFFPDPAGADFGPFSAAGTDIDLSPRPSFFFPTAAAVLLTGFSSVPLPALRRVLAGAAAVSFFSHSDPYESPSSTFAARPSLSLSSPVTPSPP
uniref:Uncharacterized protein n=1 Tax=Oryza glumipatula TaxID=40148 RepID=A0A0D9YY85_9ORYZ